MKRILCLDPGPERTGWCVLDVDDWKVVQTGHADWETVLDMLLRADFAGVAAEAIVMYTFPGASPNNRLVLATNFQLGRVFQVCRDLGVEYRQETRARIIRQLTGLFVYGTKTDDEGARKCVSVSKADMQATVQQLLGHFDFDVDRGLVSLPESSHRLFILNNPVQTAAGVEPVGKGDDGVK